MAASGSKSVTVTSWNTLKFSWTLSSQSVADNNSVVKWELLLVAGSYGRISSSASKDWSVTVNGTKYSGTNSIDVSNNSDRVLASGKTTIAHNADGTKTFSYSFSQEFGITFSGSSIGTKSGSGTGTLNTIPRATTPTLSNTSVMMLNDVTINTPRASSSFTHDLAYSFAGSGWVSIATGVATSKTWTVPDLATKVPNSISGIMTIRCITKNGSTTVGTKTVLLTVMVRSGWNPTINSVKLEETATGIAAQFGAFIQNKSKVKVTIDADGIKGSTIASYRSKFQSITYLNSTIDLGTMKNSGTMTMTTEVTDSRGRKASKTTTWNVLAYKEPTINAFSAYRCTEDGTMADDGTYVLASYNYTAPSLNGGNTVDMAIQRKLTTETEWETLHTGTDLSASGSVLLAGFSIDNQWDLRLAVTDWFGEPAYYPVIIPTAEVILDIKADGTGLGIGKVAELSNLLDIDWQSRTLGGFMPIVLENGTDLNDLLDPNTYTGKNANSGEYLNCPINTFTFSLEVLAVGDVGQRVQRLTTCSKTTPSVYERFYYQGSWGEWLLVYSVS